MANKKISQLTTAANVGVGDYFPVAVAAGGSNFITKKAETETVATYVLSPVPSAISQIGFTGNNEVYFDKSNWVDTSTAGGGTHAYVMVNTGNGQLTTGSGIGNPVGGDNMGDCVATTDVRMQNKNITGVNSINFHGGINTLIEYNNNVGFMFDLKVQAAQDLTLSGYRHVNISGQALDVASTPISGNVTVTGGDIEIDPANKLIVNEIKVARGTAANDSGSLVIEGASRHEPYNVDGFGVVYWTESNIQYDTVNSATAEFDFEGAGNGQTLTMYIENTHNSVVSTPTFVSGSTTPNPILWGGTGGPPQLEPNRTNVYTFVCVNTGIFASAVTGYEY